MASNLSLIVLRNALELGNKVDKHLKKLLNEDKSFIVPIEESRFSNGEGKIKILESVREKDVYILSDIGNYGLSYQMYGNTHLVAPDEHYADIKRVIGASADHAKRVSLVTPLLYESRQDKRKGRESLDCALGLQELERLGIKNLVTFDAHNPSVCNAVPRMSFDNFYPTSIILFNLLNNIKTTINDWLVLSPDFGATERARYYAEMLESDVGIFYKRRDYSQVVNGKNPIVEHMYIGPDMKDKNVLIVDDMIASGASVMDVARDAKIRGAKKAIICATFALFTEGIEKIEEEYNKGTFDYIYSTNLSYIPESIKNRPWYIDVDCSLMIARIIANLYNGESLEPIHHEDSKTYMKIRERL